MFRLKRGEIMEENNTIDPSMQEKIKQLGLHIQKMEKESTSFFEEIGLPPHRLHEALNNPELYSASCFEYIQKQREHLENALNRRIEDVRASVKKGTNDDTGDVKGHWIFVR